MGISNDEDLRLSDSDAQETLPLYEEAHKPSPVTSLPPPEATPDEVRDWIVQALQARGHGIDYARRVAAKWSHGTGQELKSYPLSMRLQIFGPEDAWAVSRELRIIAFREQDAKLVKQRPYFREYSCRHSS